MFDCDLIIIFLLQLFGNNDM